MRQHFLPDFVAISMTKSQFCFSTGLTPYKLKQIINAKWDKYKRLGLKKTDKLLMPSVVHELLSDTGLRINVDYFTQYVAGQRGQATPVIVE